MLVYLIRHGETTGDVENRYGGDYDDHLSEKGKVDANNLANELLNKNIEVIFHSSRIRTIETAEFVAKKINVPLINEPNLRERNQYGVLSGLKKEEAIISFPLEVEKLKIHPYKNFVTNSESYESFLVRVRAVFNKIISCKKDTIAIITHGGVIKALFREVFNFGEFKTLGDCAIIVLKVESDKVSLISLTRAEIEKKA